MKTKQSVIGASYLGREIRISPKSAVLINQEGFSVEFEEQSVMVRINIGEDEAVLLMSKKTFEKLSGAEISCLTFKKFHKEWQDSFFK